MPRLHATARAVTLPAMPPENRPAILVIDDEPDLLEVLTRLLGDRFLVRLR